MILFSVLAPFFKKNLFLKPQFRLSPKCQIQHKNKRLNNLSKIGRAKVMRKARPSGFGWNYCITSSASTTRWHGCSLSCPWRPSPRKKAPISSMPISLPPESWLSRKARMLTSRSRPNKAMARNWRLINRPVVMPKDCLCRKSPDGLWPATLPLLRCTTWSIPTMPLKWFN